MESFKIEDTVYENHVIETVKKLSIYSINYKDAVNELYVDDSNLDVNSCVIKNKEEDDLDGKLINFLYNNHQNSYRKKFTKRINKWQGVIIDVDQNNFTAKLFDLKEMGTYEIAEFSILDDVSIEDRDLIKEGAVFYWFVGYVSDRGTMYKQSEVRFKRVASISVEEIDQISDSVREKYKDVFWE